MVEVARRTSTTIPTGAGVSSPGVKATWTRIARTRLVRMSTAETKYCYRHPDRETGLSCSDCGRPICVDCMTVAPVGIRCPEHAGKRQSPSRPVRSVQRTAARRGFVISGDAIVTRVLVGVNVLMYLVGVAQGGGINSPGGSLFANLWLDGPQVANGGWWRLITAAFLHANLLHIVFNMLAL